MEHQTKKTPRQIAAWIGIILLVVLVISTLVVACSTFPGQDKVFIALTLLDIVIPVFLWFTLRLAKNNEMRNQNEEVDEEAEE